MTLRFRPLEPRKYLILSDDRPIGWIEQFVERHVFDDPTITACVADPDERNTRSLAAFRHAGFERAGSAMGHAVMRKAR